MVNGIMISCLRQSCLLLRSFFEQDKVIFVAIDPFDLEDIHSFKHGWISPEDGVTVHMHAYEVIFENINEFVSTEGQDMQDAYRNYFIGQ